MTAQPQGNRWSRHRGQHQIRHRRHHVEEPEAVDQLAPQGKDRWPEHPRHLLEHLRAFVALRADGVGESRARSPGVARPDRRCRRGAPTASPKSGYPSPPRSPSSTYVDRHEGDQVELQNLASIREQTTQRTTRDCGDEVGHRRPVVLRRALRVGERDSADPGGNSSPRRGVR